MAETVLAVDSLSKSFGAIAATRNVTLDLRRGEIHALIGPNGAGKSTLVKQIAGELRQDAGTIRFAGRNVDGIDAVGRARLGMARTFQVSCLAMELSVLRNVMLAVAGESGKVFRLFPAANADAAITGPAREYLGAVGLEERAMIRVADLSHGERRRLEIAMALAMRPKAFLMDEPMAGMGPEGARTLTPLLDNLREQAPILLIEHDMDAVFALADRVSVLVNGELIATGSVDEIRADPDVQKSYLGDGE
ncbi:MAG: ABC transporter ATP-binding protein [Nitratireductor sp.]|nr:ABC transporter ATP-binding protein [Nitratireductor sp.]